MTAKEIAAMAFPSHEEIAADRAPFVEMDLLYVVDVVIAIRVIRAIEHQLPLFVLDQPEFAGFTVGAKPIINRLIGPMVQFANLAL